MSKKRGFTLVEVLVVIAITTLVFALVGGAMVFLTKSSGDLIHKSEEIIQTQTIEKHLRSLVGDENKCTLNAQQNQSMNIYQINGLEVKWDNKTLTINGTEYDDTGLYSFSIDHSSGFVKCTLTYTNGGTYTFILGIYTKQ